MRPTGPAGGVRKMIPKDYMRRSRASVGGIRGCEKSDGRFGMLWSGLQVVPVKIRRLDTVVFYGTLPEDGS